jgi:2OG-Fe(II) oxygenase superfamily
MKRKRNKEEKTTEKKKIIQSQLTFGSTTNNTQKKPTVEKKWVAFPSRPSSFRNRVEKISTIPIRDQRCHVQLRVSSASYLLFQASEEVQFRWCCEPFHNGFLLLEQMTPIRRPMIRIYPEVLDKKDANRWFHELGSDPRWKRYHRPSPDPTQPDVAQPRYQIGFSAKTDTDAYQYSGFQVPLSDYSTIMKEIDQVLSTHIGCQNTFYLANLYEPSDCAQPRDPTHATVGQDDCIGEHSDKETSLDPKKSIISVSLGDTRKFVIRVRADWITSLTASQRVLGEIDLGHGSVIEMCPGMQTLLSHEVPRRNEADMIKYPTVWGCRINLTGRVILPHSSSSSSS